MKASSVLYLILLVAAPALADDPPASADSVHQLIALTQPQRMLEDTRARLDAAFDAGVKAKLGDKTLTPRQQALLDEYRKRITALMGQTLDWSAMEPTMIEAYTSTFSQKDIDAMIAFYRTDAGQAVINKMPALMQTFMQRMQANMAKLLPQVEDLQRELAARVREDANAK